MGRRRDRNYSPQKNTSIQDIQGIEENGYPNKIMITLRNPAMPMKTPSKKKSCKKSLRIS
jgi:hypothetical protein